MELTVENCAGYLGGDYKVRELGGGVSNRVMLVEGEGKRFVLKQSLDKLRVKDDWRADRSRIFREMQSLRDVSRFLPKGSVPDVLWVDDANFLFAMEAAQPGAASWKADLLAGRIDLTVAEKVGVLLGLMIRETWGREECRRRYGDQTAFDQLRIDPYYRTTAARRPEVAEAIRELIAESGARKVSLVHGDWSPKNFLVDGARVMAIDFEVVHYGDPSFDAAFCLNHLFLKCFRRPEHRARYISAANLFWTSLEQVLPLEAMGWFEAAAMRHLGCLMLARIDGKSPVEYITEDDLKQKVRETAIAIIRERPPTLKACIDAIPH